MKDVKDIVCYADRKLYDFDEVIGNFDKYYVFDCFDGSIYQFL